MTIGNLSFPQTGKGRSTSRGRLHLGRRMVVNDAVWRFLLAATAAVLLCAGYSTSGQAAPLEPVQPPDAAGEGGTVPSGQTPISPGAAHSATGTVRNQTAAPPLEDITGQPLGSSATGAGQAPGSTVEEAGPESGFVPPGFAIPATLSTRNWFELHDWYTESDAQVFNHSRQQRGGVVLFDTEDGRVFQRDDLSIGIAAGAHLTLGAYLGEDYQKHDHSLEFTFQGLDSWNGHFALTAGMQSMSDASGTPQFGSLFNTFNFANSDFFSHADFYRFDYRSELNSGELNIRVKTHYLQDQLVYEPEDGLWNRHIASTASFSYLFGVRYLNLGERLNIASGLNGTSGTIDGFPAADIGGTINSRIQNNLVGPQAGFQMDYQYERWFAGVRGKSAVCLNFAENETDIVFNDPANPAQHYLASKTGPAAVSEISLLAGYQISPQARLRMTYDFEFLTSVGLAPNQLNLAGPHGPGTITVSNGLFLNGVSIGLDYVY
jgi:hypothetical protein